jgi:hypothetical protein
MRFEIKSIENDVFHSYISRGARLKRVPGTAKKSVRVSVTWESRDGIVNLGVRRPTRVAAVGVVLEVLGISDERWAGMLKRYTARKQKEQQQAADRAEKYRVQKLKSLVLAGEKAHRLLGGRW